MKKKLVLLLAILLSFSMIAAACGGDDDDSSSSSGSDSSSSAASEADADPVAEGMARAQAVVDAYSNPPEAITVTEPLSSVPAEGKTVAWLACEVTCAAFNPAFEAATDALNWNLEIINISSFDANSSILTAIDLGADFIAITGTPPATFADELEIMVDKGLSLIHISEPTRPY